MANTLKIKQRDRDTIIQSLRSGVTPRIGLQHIQVGRRDEVNALVKDVESIANGGATIRFIIGAYGSGKSFFLQLVRSIALEKNLVTIHADLSPDRRLHASKGQTRNLYAELMYNLSTRTKPDGSAILSVVEKFITMAIKSSADSGKSVSQEISDKLSNLTELVGGYDFAKVIESYWLGHDQGNEQLKSDTIRWLRAEFTTKTDAKNALGVRTIIDDSNFYESIKLLSLFVQEAGYKGLLVNLDEMVNLYKLNSAVSRRANYEQILRIVNDCLQGSAKNLGFLFGGTPEFLFDTHKGLFSYEALQSRLAENSFAKTSGIIDYSSPTLHLANLTPEELFLLLKNLRNVFARGEENNYLLPDEALLAFLEYCSEQIGNAYFRTPRNTIKAFLDLLSLLEQDSNLQWQSLLQHISIIEERNTDFDDIPLDIENLDLIGDELTKFKL